MASATMIPSASPQPSLTAIKPSLESGRSGTSRRVCQPLNLGKAHEARRHRHQQGDVTAPPGDASSSSRPSDRSEKSCSLKIPRPLRAGERGASQGPDRPSSPSSDRESIQAGSMTISRKSPRGASRSSEKSAQSTPRNSAVDISHFETMNLLGTGALGKVVQARNIETDEIVALKIVSLRKTDNQQRASVLTERKILGMVDHPNIIKLRVAFRSPGLLCLALELASRGDLAEHLKRWRVFPVDTVRFIAAELISALACLRRKNIVHRDLKLENILIGDGGHCKITDFNSAKILATPMDETTDSPDSARSSASSPILAPSDRRPNLGAKQDGNFVGTANYLSPEAIAAGSDADVGFEADLWALGCIVYQMSTGKFPFRAPSLELMMQRIQKREVQFPAGFDPDAKDFVRRLLKKSPAARLGADNLDALTSHRFFRVFEWDRLHDMEPPDITRIDWSSAEKRSVKASIDLTNFEFTPGLGESFRGIQEAISSAMGAAAFADESQTVRYHHGHPSPRREARPASLTTKAAMAGVSNGPSRSTSTTSTKPGECSASGDWLHEEESKGDSDSNSGESGDEEVAKRCITDSPRRILEPSNLATSVSSRWPDHDTDHQINLSGACGGGDQSSRRVPLAEELLAAASGKPWYLRVRNC